jgi:hypothetical protein
MPAGRARGSQDCDELIRRLKSATWPAAVDNLRALWEKGGSDARKAAAAYGSVYRDRRAAMVFDCVMSRQRNYTKVVLPLVAEFERTPAAGSLRTLASDGPGTAGPSRSFPFRRGEAETVRLVAEGLVRCCDEQGLDEETGVRRWADRSGVFERRSFQEPYVGSVKGIGTALFSYLRMRCGADAIKPDVRVRAALGSLLFPLGDNSDFAVLCVAAAAAKEIGISRLELDQLLWWMQERDAEP